MGIIEMLLLVIALDLDFFFVALGIGARNRKAEELPILSLIIACIQSLFPVIGFMLGGFLNSMLGMAAHYIGALILAGAGFQIFREYVGSPYKPISAKNMLLVLGGACAEDLVTGIGLGVNGGKAVMFFILSFIIAFFMNLSAMKLGRSLRRLFNFPVDALTGIILMLMGIAGFLGIL